MTVIIVILLVAALAAAVYPTVKHFRGQGGCCGGGGSYRPRRKKLPQVKYKREFTVTGMHCAGCRARVEEAVNDIHGVAGRVTNLRRGTLLVSYAEGAESAEDVDGVIIAKLARLGYVAVPRG